MLKTQLPNHKYKSRSQLEGFFASAYKKNSRYFTVQTEAALKNVYSDSLLNILRDHQA